MIPASTLLWVSLAGACSPMPPLVNHQPSETPLADAWRAYAAGEAASASDFIEPQAIGVYLSWTPPHSPLMRQIRTASEQRFGDYGRLFIEVGAFRTWVAMRRGRDDGRWRLTLDERPILSALTQSWPTERIGRVVYHSRQPLSDAQRTEASQLNEEMRRLDDVFGFLLQDAEYYLAAEGSADALDVVGETNRGAGKARIRAIKAVGVANHRHELVHLYALEIGMVNAFLDEGLATALGSDDRIRDRDDCRDVLDLAGNGYERFLAPGVFSEAHTLHHRNVYGLAQITVGHWKDAFGMRAILAVLRAAVARRASAEELLAIIASRLESPATTNAWLRDHLESACGSPTERVDAAPTEPAGPNP